MTIDLKWGLPFVLPFVFLGMIQLLFWQAGVELSGLRAEITLALSAIVGFLSGAFIASLMNDEAVYWRVTIGKKRSERHDP